MLLKEIEDGLKSAMKKRDAVRVSVLRLLKNSINNYMIERNTSDISEAEVSALIRKDIKRHEDSIAQFKNGKREDLAGREEEELKILKSYLPSEMTPEQIREVVNKIVEQTNASGKRDFGKVMKAVMQELQGKADGKVVSSVVSEILGE